jgi:hypothetical protein
MNQSTVTNRTEIQMAARFITANLLIGDVRIVTGEFGFA